MGAFGLLISVNRMPRTDSVTFAMIVIGFLMSYLGLTRLVVLPLTRRFGRLLSIPIGTMAIVMTLAALLPTILSVVLTGSPPADYTPLEAMDWAWTLVEAFETRYSPPLAILILVTGILITVFNLMLLFREFQYRRVSIPERVLEDQQAGSR